MTAAARQHPNRIPCACASCGGLIPHGAKIVLVVPPVFQLRLGERMKPYHPACHKREFPAEVVS